MSETEKNIRRIVSALVWGVVSTYQEAKRQEDEAVEALLREIERAQSLQPQEEAASTHRDGFPDFYIAWCRHHEHLGCYECGRLLVIDESFCGSEDSRRPNA